jgi:hypothetical protein
MLAVFGEYEAHCFYGREGAHRKGRTGVWPESVLYDQLGSGGFIYRKKHKTGQTFFLTLDHPTLPFGFEIGKIVKYASHNSDQLDLIVEKISRAGAASSQAVRAKDYGPSRKSDYEKSRCV